MYKFVILSFSIYTVIMTVQTDTSPQNNLSRIKSQFFPPEFSNTNFTMDDAKKILKDKCQKISQGNETVYLQAQKGIGEFVKCVSSLANLTALQKEMEIAKPLGELDTVFAKYCNKRPQAELCVNNLNYKIQPCLNEEEKAHKESMLRIVTSLMGFICQKGGDQIALFVAEGGQECLEVNKENINSCLNASFASYIPKNGIPDVNDMPQFAVGKKECNDLQNFEECILMHLEKCNDITPSNIVESIFKFVKNETNCPTRSIEKTARSAESMHVLNIGLLLSLISIMIAKKIVFGIII